METAAIPCILEDSSPSHLKAPVPPGGNRARAEHSQRREQGCAQVKTCTPAFISAKLGHHPPSIVVGRTQKLTRPCVPISATADRWADAATEGYLHDINTWLRSHLGISLRDARPPAKNTHTAKLHVLQQQKLEPMKPQGGGRQLGSRESSPYLPTDRCLSCTRR